MAKGKQTCKILKEIRRQIAVENDIEFVTSECTYKGDCQGTCPKCEAEVRYLERELENANAWARSLSLPACRLAPCSLRLPVTLQQMWRQTPVMAPRQHGTTPVKEKLKAW